MRRWQLAPFFALSTVLVTPMGASAQVTMDVTKITCEQFLEGKVGDSRSVTIWLSGYYHGVHNNTRLDVSALQQNSQTLMDYCLSHPNINVMDAITTLLEKQN